MVKPPRKPKAVKVSAKKPKPVTELENVIIPVVKKVMKYKIDPKLFQILAFQNKELFKEKSQAYEEKVILDTFDQLAVRCKIIEED